MLSACSFQLHKNGQEIPTFHNAVSEAGRISGTYFAYEIAARLRATELRALDNSGRKGVCVEESISIILFLVSHHSIFFFYLGGCCGFRVFFLEPRLMVRAHKMFAKFTETL